MLKFETLVYVIYTGLILLYAASIRIFFYGLESSDNVTKLQAINLSGLVLIFALAMTFNLILFKGIYELKKIEISKN